MLENMTLSFSLWISDIVSLRSKSIIGCIFGSRLDTNIAGASQRYRVEGALKETLLQPVQSIELDTRQTGKLWESCISFCILRRKKA